VLLTLPLALNVKPLQFFIKKHVIITAPTKPLSLTENVLNAKPDVNFALLITVTSAPKVSNSEETNVSRFAVKDTLLKEINVFLAMTPTALSANLRTNAKPARLPTYSMLTTAALLIAETDPTKT
jgi:hypothetical protein